MKNKKGFTLIEITAVIALIGVLMLLIVPNVAKSLREGRKNLFYDDVVSVLASATTTYLFNQSQEAGTSKEFCADKFQIENAIGADVSSDTYYKVVVNSYGGVTYLEVSNKYFSYYETNNTDEGIKKSDVVMNNVQDSTRNIRCATSPESGDEWDAIYVGYTNSATTCKNVDCALKELYSKF